MPHTHSKIRIDFLLFLFVSLFVLGAVAQQARKVDNNALKSSGNTGEEWLTYGLDYAETRYSRLQQIDTTNVMRLGLSWVYDVSLAGRPEATPLVANGTLYWIASGSVAIALDARSGKEKWRDDPKNGCLPVSARSDRPARPYDLQPVAAC